MVDQVPPADPVNPLSHLLIQLRRYFAAVPRTPQHERAACSVALVELARLVLDCARDTQDPMWLAHLRLTEWAYGIRDLDNGRVAPFLQKSKRKAGNAPDSSVKWMKRVLVLAAQYALHQSGMTMQAATRHIDFELTQRPDRTRRPDLKVLMTRAEDLPSAIEHWRKKLKNAKPGTLHHEFSEQLIYLQQMMQRKVPSTQWRALAHSLLACI